MRTKHFLAALCVPMAFAACSNEEFVNEFPSLESRGTVDVTITAEKPSIWAADTRMSIGGDYKFLWETEGDVIGAALADGAVAGTIANDVYVNYPFTPVSNGSVSNFNSKSSLTGGNYLFYYRYTDVLDRKELGLNVPAQEYDVAKEKSALEQAANYMRMISPIVDLNKGVGYDKAQDYNLNLRFANLYSIVKVNIASANIKAGVTPTVKKVTLNTVSNNSVTGFVKTAIIDLTEIEKAGVVVPGEDGTLPAAKMDAALEELNKIISDANNSVSAKVSPIYAAAAGASIGYGAAEVSVKGDLALSTAEETSLYILVPKGTYDAGLILTVETSEGNATRNVTPATGKHLVLDDQVKAIGIDLDFGIDGNVKLPNPINVSSSADWAAAVKFVEDHSLGYVGKTVQFNLTAATKDLEISSFPDFELEITGEDKTVTLTGNHVFNADNAVRVKSTTATLAVKDGVTLTLDTDVEDCFKAIENNGTLIVNGDQAGVITNLGVMNVAKDASLTGGLTNGKAKTAEAAAVEGTINIAKGKVLTIATAAMSNLAGAVKVDGTLTINNASTSAATITVSKDGQIDGTADITNTGTIDNAGVLKTGITNDGDGSFIIQKDSKSDNSATITDGTVEVKDVTTFAGLQGGDAKYTFSSAVVSTKTTSKAEFAKANTSASGITNIILNGGDWTFSTSAYAGAGEDSKTLTTLVAEVTDGITLSNGATLALGTTMAGDITVADGTSTIKSATALSLTTADVTVKAGATLNVEGLVTINVATAVGTEMATIEGTLNVKNGAKMHFATAKVGTKDSNAGKIVVFGNKASVDDRGQFGVKTAASFQNFGTVESKAGEFSGDEKVGLVTQPANEAGATFIGNPAAGSDFTWV